MAKFCKCQGVPIIRFGNADDKEPRSGTFLIIFFHVAEDEHWLKHEWGHVPQQLFLGPIKYLLFIMSPSAASGDLDDEPYYNRPWEATAELFGESIAVGYKVYDESKFLSLLYLAFVWAL